MAIEDVISNVSDAFNILPPEVVASLDSLFLVLKAAGIAFIAYVLYVLVMAFINYRKIRRMIKIEKTVNAIDEKLDILLSKDKKENGGKKKDKKKSKK